ncbi:hypothetical protein IWQ60_005521 [Tieghemiomyces parasiticus]|uniref:Prenylcysteine lyase domain-containing protein n=1 Tax=Tieghemiomyces parasiticus TaxID=78921 RepID=A0A9W8DY51_9FUNG|nr:hypothetical protein IWQ60_005521 [Tieghemiomyces parasiticus]
MSAVWHDSKSSARRVAVIGGGASGTSAAYFIRQNCEARGLDVDITILEHTERIGGRTMVTSPPAPLDHLKLEVGASIFVKENKYLVDFAKRAGLITLELAKKHEPRRPRLGIWNGRGFNLLTTGSRWRDLFLVLRTYGIVTPYKVRGLVTGFLKKFRPIYHEHAGFPTMQAWLTKLSLNNAAERTAQTTFNMRPGLYQPYLSDIVEISSRVNYSQCLNELHTIAMSVSMVPSIDTEYQVKGGNFQVFEYLASMSRAQVLLGKSVAKVNRSPTTGTFRVTTRQGDAMDFDAVVVAVPLNIDKALPIEFTETHADADLDEGVDRSVPLPIPAPLPSVEYQTLHVTLVLAQIRRGYFFNVTNEIQGEGEGLPMPDDIFTTRQATTASPPAPFTSLSVHHTLMSEQVERYCEANGQSVEKIDFELADFTVSKLFSPQPMTEEQLDAIYASRLWTYRHAWKAYPKLVPRHDDEFPAIVLAERLYYPNAFEPFISTMETSIISARNVANLVCRDLFDEV